jgi:hypothetical protein
MDNVGRPTCLGGDRIAHRLEQVVGRSEVLLNSDLGPGQCAKIGVCRRFEKYNLRTLGQGKRACLNGVF